MWTFIGIGSAMVGILGSLAFCLLPRVAPETPVKKFGGAMTDPQAEKFGKRHDESLPQWARPPKQKRIKGPPHRTQINDHQGSGATGRNLVIRN